MNIQKYILKIIIVAASINHVNLYAQSDSLFQNKIEWEAFPILNYDSDAGFRFKAEKDFFTTF